MQIVGGAYFLVVLGLVITQWAGGASGRVMPLLELLLSAQTLAAMVAGLSGKAFWNAIHAHIRSRSSSPG